MAGQPARSADGRVWTVHPQTQELHATDEETAALKLQAGFLPATVEQVQYAQEELAARKEWEGVGGAAKAAGLAAVRGAVPMVGDDILEMFGISEKQQQRGIQEQPIASAAGEIAGFVGSAAATGGAAAALGTAARAGKAGATIARLAEAAHTAKSVKLALGAAEGAAASLAASESARIGAGVPEEKRRDLTKDVLAGAGIGAAFSVVSMLGSGALGVASRKIGLDDAAKAADKAEAGVKASLSKIRDPLARGEARATLESFRSTLAKQSDEALENMAKKGWPGGEAPSMLGLYGKRASVSAVEKGLVASEIAARSAAKGMASAAKWVSSAGVGAAVGGIPGAAVGLMAGGGAGGIVGALARRAGKTVIDDAVKSVARNAFTPMIRMATSAAGKKAKAVLSTAGGVAATTARVTGAEIVVNSGNYEQVREAIDRAPQPAERMAMIMQGTGDDPTSMQIAAQVAQQQQAVLDILDMSLPRVTNPDEIALAKTNRYLDAIVNPQNVLKRMETLGLTREDVEVMAIQDPGAVQWAKEMIEQARSEPGASFTVEQRRQQDMFIGYTAGISPLVIQQNFEDQRKAQEQGGQGKKKAPGIAGRHATPMQALET